MSKNKLGNQLVGTVFRRDAREKNSLVVDLLKRTILYVHQSKQHIFWCIVKSHTKGFISRRRSSKFYQLGTFGACSFSKSDGAGSSLSSASPTKADPFISLRTVCLKPKGSLKH